MSSGRRWLALDADMFGKPFTLDLHLEFGWAGVGTWIAFLCACKRSRTPGTVRFLNEADARSQLGILGWDLVDGLGKEWSLDDFWAFTGRKKQTRKTSRGREMNVTATHWERWQDDKRMQDGRERKRRSRDKNVRTLVTPDSDLDLDLDIPPTPQGADALRAASQNPQDLRAAVNALKATLAPPIPPKKPT